VVVDSLRCGKVVHGGVVLGAVTRSSKGAGQCYAVARRRRKWRHSGGDGRRRKKGGSTVGVGTLYSCRTRWTEGGAAVKQGAGKWRWGSHGCGKVAAASV
jgi:hypothetical protein